MKWSNGLPKHRYKSMQIEFCLIDQNILSGQFSLAKFSDQTQITLN